MKRMQKLAAAGLVAVMVGSGIPAMAAQNGYDDHDRGGMQYRSADRRGDDRGRDYRNDDRRNEYRRDYHRRDYDRRDWDRGYRDERGYGYGYSYYAPGPVYEAAPVYQAPVYDNGYPYRTHDGRTAAIIGGSAAAGAVIGAAAGHGEGAAIGAVIGGIAGVAASAAANHHDRY